MEIDVPILPELDPGFVPAALWNRAYRSAVAKSGAAVDIALALQRPDGTCSVYATQVLPPDDANEALTLRYVERILKFLLWQRGANRVMLSGCDAVAAKLADIYSTTGARHFDFEFFGQKVYGGSLQISACAPEAMPEANEETIALGRHLDGCRIGFDLGGSDRKCAALIDGKVVFSEEVEWNPYFEKDPNYHLNGINDTLRRAAAHLPRVDAIGGSAAGVYVNNEVRAASLFRGVPPELFESRVRRMFFDVMAHWNHVPFVVVNDGEVTALAGSMAMNENAVLGVSMGTSQAGGFVTPSGNITPWLNELAFAPVDYRDNAPADEWSGDLGCGVQYFSQQAIARLAPLADIDYSDDTPLPDRLVDVQRLMAAGDARAEKIYSTIGTYLGYSIAHYADFYALRSLLLLGRVTSGEGGARIIENAENVLRDVFPDCAGRIAIRTLDEQQKRHGQAVAAASLPEIGVS